MENEIVYADDIQLCCAVDRSLTHAQQTCTRNLHKFLALNFDPGSCKLLYKLARGIDVFNLVQETCNRKTCARRHVRRVSFLCKSTSSSSSSFMCKNEQQKGNNSTCV